ncbi:hypothetical protein HWV62_28302 [Athelia sp. TMB]|nr:hypothetical protein HWV62_28302 [Athelia sp. TMB]
MDVNETIGHQTLPPDVALLVLQEQQSLAERQEFIVEQQQAIVQGQKDIQRQVQQLQSPSMAARKRAHPRGSGSPPDGDADNEGEDEDESADEAKPKPRKLPSKFHRLIQASLRDESVLAKPGEKAKYPSVTPDVLNNFLANGTQGPTRTILLDWSVGFHFHLWNTEAISLLVQRCLQDLQADVDLAEAFKKRSLKLTHDLVQRAVKVKLRKVAREARHALEHGQEAFEQRQEEIKTQDRRTTRRNTVYKRCRKIVDQNKHRNPAIWGNVSTALNKLGIQGMSGDETDTQSHRAKKMRRMKHSWLNPKITELWAALDSYEHAVMEELLLNEGAQLAIAAEDPVDVPVLTIHNSPQ